MDKLIDGIHFKAEPKKIIELGLKNAKTADLIEELENREGVDRWELDSDDKSDEFDVEGPALVLIIK